MKHIFLVLLVSLTSACSLAPSQGSPTSGSELPTKDDTGKVDVGVTVTTLEDEAIGPGTVMEKPTNPAVDALRKEAQTAVLAGRYDSAAIAMERAVRIDPRDPYVWLELAKIRYTQGDYAQARELAGKARRLAGVDGRVKAEADELIRRSR